MASAVRVFDFDRVLSQSSATSFIANRKLSRSQFHDKLSLSDYNHISLRPFWLALLTGTLEFTTDIYTYIGQYGKYYSMMYKKMQAYLHKMQRYRFNLKTSVLDPSHYVLLMYTKDFISVLPSLQDKMATIVEHLLQCMIFLNSQYNGYLQEYSQTEKTDKFSIHVPTDIYESLHYCVQNFVSHHHTLSKDSGIIINGPSLIDRKDKHRITYISLWEITDVLEIQKAYHYKLNRFRRPIDYTQDNFNTIVHGWVVVARQSSTFLQGVDEINARFKSHVNIAQLETTYPFRDVGLALCNLIKRMHHTSQKYTFIAYKGLIMMMDKTPAIEEYRMYVPTEMNLCFEKTRRETIDWSYDANDAEYPSRWFMNELVTTMVTRGNLYMDYLIDRIYTSEQYDLSTEDEASLMARFPEHLPRLPSPPCGSPFSSSSSSSAASSASSALMEVDDVDNAADDCSRSSTPRLIIDDNEKDWPCITINDSDDDEMQQRPTVIVFAGKK